MAASTGVYIVNAEAGVNVYDASSTPHFGLNFNVLSSDGFKRIYGKMIKAMGSIQTCSIKTAGSIVTVGSTTATFICDTAGGFAAGQHGFIKKRTL